MWIEPERASTASMCPCLSTRIPAIDWSISLCGGWPKTKSATPASFSLTMQ